VIKRRQNWRGQQRIDVPHLRAMESSASNDFDSLAGDIIAGNSPLVIRGFTLSMIGAIGSPATSLSMLVADSALIHPGATESGSIFSTDVNASPEVLSSTNSKVEGAFTADATNFIGLDLRRSADATTTDTVMFLDSSTGLESPESVPLAITMDYKIVISTTDFAVTPHICPIAVVVTSGGNVSSITDARPMIGRLAPGGSNPDEQGSFAWSQGRLDGVADSATAFTGGDKAIRSVKDSLDAIMTRVWELGGGERWFAATSDRDLKVTFGQPVLSNGDNFDFDSGTGDTDWASVTVTFANSTGYLNEIQDSSVVGTAVLADGQCLYVDVDRTQNLTGVNGLIPQVADLLTLGSPSVPGGITVWLNTPGGSVSDGQAIFDAIQMTTNPVTAIGTGMVASMGALLLQAADQRLATPLTRIMIHDGEAQVDGPLREVISSGKELERSMRQHFEVFVQKTGLSLKEIEAISATGRWFSAEEALEKNLIDGIVVSKDVFDKSNKDKKTARSKRTPRKRTNK